MVVVAAILDKIPYVTSSQMREIDRLIIQNYHITLIQMMEHAGTNLSVIARNLFLKQECEGKKVLILAGTGNNGGGGIVCGRILSNWGAEITIALSRGQQFYRDVPLQQLQIAQAMKLQTEEFSIDFVSGKKYDLLIDAILGYNIKGPPKGTPKEMIDWANLQTQPILSLDLPSGCDPDGTIYSPCIHASATMTLAIPKILFKDAIAKEFVGKLFLADISIPILLYEEPTLKLPVPNMFSHSQIIRL